MTHITSSVDRADVGIILEEAHDVEGSGFNSLLDDLETLTVSTPYGEPSAEIAVGTLSGRRVAMLPRHGVGHRFAPHVVPYRANLWALRSLGVRQVVALSSVGPLRAEIAPGSLVVPDQVLDRTHGRAHSLFDAGTGVAYAAFDQPYCQHGRSAALASARDLGWDVADGGTYLVINGPRFPSGAEEVEHRSSGASVIGMVGMPEAGLARELALCYTSPALVTDLDLGDRTGPGVSGDDVKRNFVERMTRFQELVGAIVAALPAEQKDCACGATYAAMPPPIALP